ncbi:hypothetical protein [Sinomonas sp. G460-2]|uniref:hypothetical protein n=1 Tax=Sinomonas sp. G460-2 TaxID=3393464 RepID=UPI0039EFD10B
MSALTQYTVDAVHTPGLSEVVASLPLSLTRAGEEPAQLATITGARGWADRALEAFDGGALAAVVSSPSADEGVPALPADIATRAIIEWAFACNPGVLVAAEAAAPLRERAVFADVELRLPTGADPDTALLDTLTAASRVLGPLTPVRSLHRDKASWHLSGSLTEDAPTAPVAIAIIVTDAAPARLRLRLLTLDGGLTAVVPAPDTAAPAEVRIVGPDGERLLPTLWETSRRSAWRRAVAIAAGELVSADVAELYRVAALVPAHQG